MLAIMLMRTGATKSPARSFTSNAMARTSVPRAIAYGRVRGEKAFASAAANDPSPLAAFRKP